MHENNDNLADWQKFMHRTLIYGGCISALIAAMNVAFPSIHFYTNTDLLSNALNNIISGKTIRYMLEKSYVLFYSMYLFCHIYDYIKYTVPILQRVLIAVVLFIAFEILDIFIGLMIAGAFGDAL